MENEDRADQTSPAIEFWKEQVKKFIEGTQKYLMLVIGAVGSGKSAITLHITKPDDLMAKRKENAADAFDIFDKNNL